MAQPETPQTTIQHMHIVRWITKLQTHTTNMQYFLLFHATNGYVYAPQCYVHMYTAFLVSLPEAVIVIDAVTSSDGRKTTIF